MDAAAPLTPSTGLTTAEIAVRLRVGQAKVLGWIGRGELRAINRAASLSARPLWVVTPEDLAAFEAARSNLATVVKPPPVKRGRQKPRPGVTQFF